MGLFSTLQQMSMEIIMDMEMLVEIMLQTMEQTTLPDMLSMGIKILLV
jgi:hypothetical protein